MSVLDKEINKLESRLSNLKKCAIRKEIILHELEILQVDYRKSKARLKKEKRDVEQLENNNIRWLFTDILGSKEEQLEIERQEYLQEVLHHNSLIDEINVLKYELQVLEEKLNDKEDDLELELKRAYSRKQNLLEKNPEARKKITEFILKEQKLRNAYYNFQEAIAVGKILQVKLQGIVEDLNQVKRWGPIRMKGKGKRSTPGKKSFIDKANNEVTEVQVLIKKFDKELKDVYPSSSYNYSMVNYRDFIDQFHDHFITDWMVQKKLNHAIYGSIYLRDKIQRILMALNNDLKKVSIRIDVLEEDRRTYLKEFE